MAASPDPGALTDPDGLNIVVREQGITTVIELHGEWDLAALPSIQQTISRVLDDVPECIVLDLSRLGFIDSSGLHATVELTRRLAGENRQLVIVPGPGPVQRMFEITGLLERLPFIDRPPMGARVTRSHTGQRSAARPRPFSSPCIGAGGRP